MPPFRRYFDVAVLAEWNEGNPGNVVRALFDRWALPGVKGKAFATLRVGVRAGYVNFYAKGQSVAKLSAARGGPSLSVHNAYVKGRRRGEGVREHGYMTFDARKLADPAIAGLIDGWIATALTHASAEKHFVDDLVAANAGVIDLEMGLPAHDDLTSDRAAPRMDLVVVEQGADGPSIAFWEVKCANNDELRADSKRGADPRILRQISRYIDWMNSEGRIAQVRDAYRRAASDLLRCLRHFGPAGSEAAVCASFWRLLIDAEKPIIVVRPGVVIGNHWPDDYKANVVGQRMQQAATTFARNGHRDRLIARGVILHEVGEGYQGPVLPHLSSV